MKKLQLFTGGHKLRLDDLVHIQNGLLESIIGLMSSYGDNLILEGCDYDGANLTAGYIFMNGEVFEVAAKATGGAYATPVFTVLETLDPASPVVYQDGNSRNVHIIRKADLQEDAAQTEKVALDQFIRLHAVGSITAEAGYPFTDATVEIFRNKVRLRGTVENDSGTSLAGTGQSAHVGTIDDEKYRPAAAKWFNLQIDVDSALNAGLRYLEIKANGQIFVHRWYAGGEKLELDQIEFDIV